MNPPEVSIKWCPKCGRTDRYTTLALFPKKHFSQGTMCDGKPVVVVYTEGTVAE